MAALSRILRMMLQSAVLGIGAWLVINQQATAGIIIASSILTSRALAPVEVTLAHWRSFISARQSWRRLNGLLGAVPAEQARMDLPRPKRDADARSVGVNPPGTNRIVVQGVAFQLKAGQGLGVIGPSASGKSSLVRAIVGVWPAGQGKIRIDGAAIDQWTPEALGPHIGYLPQDMELFAGTVAREHRALRARRPDPEEVIAAAQAAGVHELILRPAQRLRDPGRRQRRRALGRPAPAHRPGARALRRSVPGRARRAQLQPRPRGRRGADQAPSSACARAAASSSWSPPAARAGRRRHGAGHAERPPAGVRSEGAGTAGAAAAQQPAAMPAARMVQPMTVHAGGRPQEKAP